MIDASKIKEHATVTGSDGQHVGTVDHLDGQNLKLTKNDSPDGQHHLIPLSSVASVDGGSVQLNQTAAQAKASWKNA